jgi:hypothetical protein
VVSSSVAAFDVDAGTTLTYSLATVHPVFEITPAGVVRVKAGAVLNFEVTSSYSFAIVATDQGGLFASNVLSVTVLDVNEAPTLSAASRSVAENSVLGTPIGAPLVASDVDAGEAFTWAIVSGGGGVVVLESSSAGQLVTGAAVDFESTASYSVVVRVTDKGGLSATATVTVSVLNVNEAPVFVAASVASKTVAENSPAWTVVGTPVSATDVDVGQTRTYSIPAGQDVFVIGATNGSISLARQVLDFETRSSYSVTVVVTDNGSPALSVTTTVVIQLQDVNERPVAVFNGLVLSVPENSAAGTVIGVLPAGDKVQRVHVHDVYPGPRHG